MRAPFADDVAGVSALGLEPSLPIAQQLALAGSERGAGDGAIGV